jgi:ammonia channel protein AmtB
LRRLRYTTKKKKTNDSFTVDDPVDAVAVHFGGGFWGLIATPFFSHGGILYDGNIESALVKTWNF